MRIPSGKTDQVLYFVAVDSTDLRTKKTGLSSFTVYRSRKGGSATAYTTPTITEISSANMPGLYSLLIDEDTTVDSGSDSEEYAVYITATGMAPVYRTAELYRRDTTSGKTAAVDSSGRVDVGAVGGTAQTAQDLGASLNTIAGYVDTEVAAIKAKTDNLPASPAAVGDIPTADDNADALLDRAAGVETGFTLRQAMRILLAVLAGKASGLNTTTATFRDMADSKDRVSAMIDTDGNRSAVTLDAS
jgi:hypothetical protein